MSGYFLLLQHFPEICVFNAKSVDPDQMSAASDLGLHYLPGSGFLNARHKWVNCDLYNLLSVDVSKKVKTMSRKCQSQNIAYQ